MRNILHTSLGHSDLEHLLNCALSCAQLWCMAAHKAWSDSLQRHGTITQPATLYARVSGVLLTLLALVLCALLASGLLVERRLS